ncbi:MAG: cysteine hydrolase family protein [Elainellaceae cyanobacterium]
MSSKNPLKRLYDGREFPSLQDGRVALLCIDIQYLDAAYGHGCFANLPAGLEPDLAYYFDRLDHTVVPNVRRFQDGFRSAEQEVIHTRIQSLTQDGRDRSLEHKRLGLHAAPGSKEAEFLPAVAPQGDEIVIPKTASGVFSCTNLDYVLRNLGMTQLVMVGVLTNECVETAARVAADQGYLVYIPEDGAATVHPDLHQDSLEAMRHTYACITSTEEILSQVQGLSMTMPASVS